MDIGTLQTFTGGLGVGSGFAGAFFVVKWLAEWMTGRMDKKEARLDRIQNDLIKGLLKDVERLKTEGAEMRTEIKGLHTQLNECETRHIEAEGKIVKLEGMLQAAGLARQMAQQIGAATRNGEEP